MLLSPETTKPLRELVEVLLRSPNTLTPAEREMIATYVSSENDCYYCQHSHGAAARSKRAENTSRRKMSRARKIRAQQTKKFMTQF